MFPHDGVGGATPSPRNESVASKMMAVGMSSVASTMTGATRLGRMSTNMIRRLPAPSECAASTYSFSRCDSACPRTILPMAANEKNAMTRIVSGRLEPKTETRTMAKRT